MSATTYPVLAHNRQAVEPTGLAFVVGFFFAARLVFGLLSVRLLGMTARDGAAASMLVDGLLLLLVCFHSLGYPHRSFASMLRVPTLRWVLVFLAFSGLSLVWSGTVSLPNSIVYWLGLVTDVAIVLLLLRTGTVTASAHSILRGYVVSACVLACIAWIMPAQTDLRLGDEELFNTNQIGNLCAFAILAAQYLTRRKERRWGWTILFLSLTLLRSLSKTTIVAFLVSQGFLLIIDRSIPRKTKVLVLLTVLLVIAAFWGLFEAYYVVYTNAGNQAETLTGRTGIWAYVSSAALDQPWIGHGFDSMWKVVPPFGPDQFEARHGENEALTQFYAYGVVGLCMMIGLYGSLFRQIRALPRGSLRAVLLSLLLFLLVRGLAEAEAFDFLLPLWAFVLFSLLLSQWNDGPVTSV